jgi:hypothetical protein
MASQLNDISVIVNNELVEYTADSLKWKDGFGEYTIRNAVVGGGQTEQIFSKDLSTKFGMVSFSIPSTQANDKLKRTWKLNDNQNVIELVGNSGSNFSKIFTNAALLGDPETNAATDGNIELEFSCNPAQ